MKGEGAIADLIAMLYEVPGSAEQWREFLNKTSQVFRAPAIGLYLWDLKTKEVNVSAGVNLGFETPFLRSYVERYAKINPFLKYHDASAQPDNLLLTQLTAPTAEVLRGEFYNEWLRPQKLWGGLSGTVHKRGSVEVILSMIRHRGARPFDERHERLVRDLMPHLQRSLELHRKIATLEMAHESAVSLLDRWPMGVILLGEKGQVLLMNRAAEKIVSDGDGLVYEAGALRASHVEERDALKGLIQNAIEASDGAKVNPGGAIALSRPSLRPPLHLLVTPIRAGRSGRSSGTLFIETQPSAVVFIGNPEPPMPPQEILRDLYRITQAEANLAILLMKGRSLKEAAQDLRIRMATARTHLAHLLDKTGTRRQAGLIRVLLSGPANLTANHRP